MSVTTFHMLQETCPRFEIAEIPQLKVSNLDCQNKQAQKFCMIASVYIRMH